MSLPTRPTYTFLYLEAGFVHHQRAKEAGGRRIHIFYHREETYTVLCVTKERDFPTRAEFRLLVTYNIKSQKMLVRPRMEVKGKFKSSVVEETECHA